MARRDVVVLAASAGGIEALGHVMAGIDPSYDGVVLVVVHVPSDGGGALARILDRAGPLPAAAAQDGEPLRSGRVYVCVPDHHLLLSDGHVLVRRGPRENGHRPAADPLFRSAAYYFGPRAVAVILSGTLSDGTAGLAAIRRRGGIAVVQDPSDAMYDGMPRSALEVVGADYVLPAAEIGPLLTRLAKEEAPNGVPPSPSAVMLKEVSLMERDDRVVGGEHPGEPSPWPCPDCNGVLWQVEDDPLRFRCRVGHAWSAESLLHEQTTGIEGALWLALRALEDRVALSRTMADRAEATGREMSAQRWRDDVREMGKSIEILRALLDADGANRELSEAAGD